MMDLQKARDRLVSAVQALPKEKRPGSGGAPADWDSSLKDDWLWHNLLLSFATMGNARGAEGLIDKPDNLSRVAYEVLVLLKPEQRRKHVEQVLREAGVRWPSRKSDLISTNVEIVCELGGPVEAGKLAMKQPGRKAKIKFLKRFKGIGDKYTRNIWRDVGHPDCEDVVALDTRIKNITRALGLSFKSYEEEEEFYISVAKTIGVTGGALDYALFDSHKEIIALLA